VSILIIPPPKEKIKFSIDKTQKKMYNKENKKISKKL